MPRMLSITLVSLALCAGSAAAAEEPKAAAPAQAVPAKIGYVNLARLFDGYEKTRASDAALEQKGKQKEAELQGRLDELKRLREGTELLNADARDQKQRQLEEKADELQRLRNSAVRDLRRERDKIAKGLLEEIQQVLEGFAKENGFSVILTSDALLYGQKSYDITDEVLALLNTRGKAKN